MHVSDSIVFAVLRNIPDMAHSKGTPLTEISLVLDWTPNTNHVGFYIAKAQGLYEKFGLSMTFISPHSDNYKITPAAKVASKSASKTHCRSHALSFLFILQLVVLSVSLWRLTLCLLHFFSIWTSSKFPWGEPFFCISLRRDDCVLIVPAPARSDTFICISQVALVLFEYSCLTNLQCV